MLFAPTTKNKNRFTNTYLFSVFLHSLLWNNIEKFSLEFLDIAHKYKMDDIIVLFNSIIGLIIVLSYNFKKAVIKRHRNSISEIILGK